MDDLRKVDGVVGVHVVYGAFDILVEVKAESMNELKQIVVNKLRRPYSESTQLVDDHVRNCDLCSRYHSGRVSLGALTKEEAIHLLNPVQGTVGLKRGIRSTLTLPVVELFEKA